MNQFQFLTQLTFLKHFFPVNCYIVEEESELTLIDAALPYSSKEIMQAANRLGKPITRIVLTHGHEDHVGSLDRLAKQLPQAKVYISERESHLLAGDRIVLPNEPLMPIKGGLSKKIKTKPDVFIAEGDRIGSLLVVSTPGHTPGMMSFFDTRTKAIIVGDAFQTRGGLAVSGQFQWLFPFPALATWNRVMALESAQKILNLNPSLLAVGHGNMLLNPSKSISKAIEKTQKHLQLDRKRVV